MPKHSDPAAGLERSWEANAAAWVKTVRSGGIASRRLATDAAIVGAVLERTTPIQGARVLDLGCGEGWLARALSAQAVRVVGIDASAPLIEAAQAVGDGAFLALSYEDLAADPAAAGVGFDVVVANFALLAADILPLLRALRLGAFGPDGVLIVQTVHPAGLGPPYRDGWRTEDFRAFGSGDGAADWQPMPWYFRTLGSWMALLRQAGYALIDLREPLHPETSLPLSLLMVAEPARSPRRGLSGSQFLS